MTYPLDRFPPMFQRLIGSLVGAAYRSGFTGKAKVEIKDPRTCVVTMTCEALDERAAKNRARDIRG